MSKYSRSAYQHITEVAMDRQRSVGSRLLALREIRHALDKAERALLVQVGVDLAKHMAAEGYAPEGKPIAWHFEQRRMQDAGITPNGDAFAGVGEAA